MHSISRVFCVAALLTVVAFVAMLNAQEKKVEQKSTILTGTLVDLACYAKGGFLTNDHGGMENCGTMCAAGGLPVALVDANKKVHFLGVPSKGYADYVGMELRLTGMYGKHAEVFIPEKLEVKENGKWVEKKLPKTMM
ncbi:MAG: hypothetical protein ONA90_06960 [candidate division KSB1 bacterium]|nr:hypothetical protein [candidate division KSB1 bacterium]